MVVRLPKRDAVAPAPRVPYWSDYVDPDLTYRSFSAQPPPMMYPPRIEGGGFSPDRQKGQAGLAPPAPVQRASLDAPGPRFRSELTTGKKTVTLDPRLRDIVETAAEQFTEGSVRLISGVAPRGTGTSNHPKGRGIDVEITDNDGNVIPNYKGKAQTPEQFAKSPYGQFAALTRRVQQEKYPELDVKFRAGGFFQGEPNPGDDMHFDLSGGLSSETPPQTREWAKLAALVPAAAPSEDVITAQLTPEEGATGNPRLPGTMARDAERLSEASQIAAAGGTKPTLTVADANATPPIAYASDRDRVFAENFADKPWASLPGEAREALTSKLGASAERQYEAARATVTQAGGEVTAAQPASVDASAPPVPRLRPDAAPMGATGIQLSDRDLDIGARIMSGEAANQGEKGRQAVAEVLLNRAAAGFNGKKTVADVALDGNGAQFNAAKKGGNKPYRNPGEQYEENKQILRELAAGQRDRLLPEGTDSFHGNGKSEKGGQVIGGHVFYSTGGVPRIQTASADEVAPVAAAEAGFPGGAPPVLGRVKPGSKPDQWTAFLQQKLKDAMPEIYGDLEVDGIYGPQTEAAVRAFSTATKDPKPNGKAGPHVWGELAMMAPQEGGFGPFPRERPATEATPPMLGKWSNERAGKYGFEDIIERSAATRDAFAGAAPKPSPAAEGAPRITPRRSPDLLESLLGQVSAGPANPAGKTDRDRIPFPNIVTDFPGYVKRSMEVAMPDAQSIPTMLRGIGGGPEIPPASNPPALPPMGDPRDMGALGGLKVLQQILAGIGVMSPESAGMPAPEASRPRIQPAVAPGGETSSYGLEPADRRAQDMAFGSGAVSAQPGATFSVGGSMDTSGGSGGESGPGSGSGEAAKSSGGSGASSGGATTSGPGTNNPNSIEQAISALSRAIDSMASVQTDDAGRVLGGI